MKRHIVDHETLYRVYTLCGRSFLKASSKNGDYPWKATDEPCKHCAKAKELNGGT